MGMKLLAEKSFTVNGPMEVTSFDLFGMTFHLSESVVVEWIVVVFLGIAFFILGRNLKVRPTSRRQMAAEYLVGLFSGMVKDTMGISYKKYTPYIGALFCFSIISSLMGLLGLRAPTADISVVASWALITFILVQRNKGKTGGVKGYFKSFVDPIPFMLPFNIIGEFANPMSQALRHFGNIVSGMVIGGLIYFALGNFAIGLPAVLSLYFDLFSSFLQAYIFVTLTMSYVSMAECD
ncbi:MAG: F0F1 ATP synthase subunit A [Ruminococcaceae bacterium]|nr:F0F1 ATP synthase subunit A [Oscillospiraceae bacterium]